MVMSKSSLKDRLKTSISAILDIANEDQLDDICQAIADSVIDEIIENAVVTGTASNVTSGGSTAPVAGTVG